MSSLILDNTFDENFVKNIQRWYRKIHYTNQVGKNKKVQDCVEMDYFRGEMDYFRGEIVRGEFEINNTSKRHAIFLNSKLWFAKYKLRKLLDRYGWEDTCYIESSKKWSSEDYNALVIQNWFNLKLWKNTYKPVNDELCIGCKLMYCDNIFCMDCKSKYSYDTCETCSPGIPILTRIRNIYDPQCEECHYLEICEAFDIKPYSQSESNNTIKCS